MNGISVIFGDVSIATIEGKENIEILDLSIFHNVLFVNDLKANLLSISQFHDENHSVLRMNETSTIVLVSGS